MTADQRSWQTWADTLHRWGVHNVVAVALEAVGPLAILGAQVIYLGQPFFDPATSRGDLTNLAELLEDPQATRSFAAFLRENPNREHE